jgi:DNA (cytosine-5)-methyltransferase 1
MSGAYYNEIDPYAAQWLRNLIAAGHIAPGDVDERDIRLVRADDLRGYTQCHFFAGIGVWSYALRQAGWSDGEDAWTGSCPCQAFSGAGRKGGFDDERHLWPHWQGLIRELRPSVVFGEQVASGDGLAWLDFVCADLEAEGYAIAPVDLCAAGFGAPHIRQRLFFVADAGRRRVWDRGQQLASQESEAGGEVWEQRLWLDSGHGCSTGTVGDPAGIGQSGRREHHGSEAQGAGQTEAIGCELREQVEERRPTGGFWGDAEWIRCLDGKARPVEPGTSPLAHGSSSRMGRLRAYGNAINAEVAAGFIRAYRMTRYCSTPQEEKGR